jgi:hypothetical protein
VRARALRQHRRLRGAERPGAERRGEPLEFDVGPADLEVTDRALAPEGRERAESAREGVRPPSEIPEVVEHLVECARRNVHRGRERDVRGKTVDLVRTERHAEAIDP